MYFIDSDRLVGVVVEIVERKMDNGIGNNYRPRWQKVLYKDQGVPDNYVDESFLGELKRKGTF